MELLIGAIVSGIVEFLKRWAGTNQWATLFVLAILSVLASALYSLFLNIGWWEYILPILVNAGGIYALIIRRFIK